MSHAEKQRSANAAGGRMARACDGCIRRRARWFCAADDAFLCQACDTSVHSANHLTRRHHRVRLKTSSSWSSSPLKSVDAALAAAPAWHQDFTRKARTPRGPHHHHHVKLVVSSKAEPVVPDLEASGDEEEQLLYRVPIFDPALAEFCSPPVLDETKPTRQTLNYTQPSTNGSDGLAEFDPSETELAEFAADVESMLGQGLDDGQFCMEELGLLDDVKVEPDADVACGGAGMGMAMGVDFDVELSRVTLEEIEERKPETRELGLMLDYEAVIDAWSVHGRSPWTDGERPQISLDDCWVDYMVVQDHQTRLSSLQMMGGSGDRKREARVTRYREKRRTRLFSKKIRYEVRKLNAEKRPRMKGRFVKRASFQAAAGLGFPY